VDRNCGPMNKNRIEGVFEQGERANGREASIATGSDRGAVRIKPCMRLRRMSSRDGAS